MNKKSISLLTALALGAASAQTVPAAGQNITNRAQIDFSYTDGAGATQTGNSQSNEVSTTVIGVPSFTITPNTGDTKLTQTAAPNSSVTFTYTVTNTGNTTLQINLASTGDLSGIVSAPQVTLAPGGDQQVTVTYTTPASTTTAQTFNNNLTGTAASNTDGSTDGSFEDTAFANPGFASNIDDNNANVINVAATVAPTSTSPTVTDPTVFPNDPANPGINDAGTTDAGTGTGPGYTTDGPGTGTEDTPVHVDPSGNQTAYPGTDTGDKAPDTVTLTGGLTNNGPAADVLTIGPASDPDGAGPATATLVNPATNAPFKTGGPVVDPNGNLITGITTVVNPDGTVSFVAANPDGTPQQKLNPDGTPAVDASGNPVYVGIPADSNPAYNVVITYPDPDSVEGTTTGAPAYTSTVPVASGNTGGNVGDTKFTVKVPNPDVVVSETPVSVQPSTTDPVTANVPTTITNNGGYTESYDLTGSTTVPGGSVTYYLDNNGDGEPDDLNGDGTPDAVTSVGPLAPDESANVIAVVTIPPNTPVDAHDLTVTATGTFSGAVSSDTVADVIQVGIVTPPAPTTTNPNDPNYTSNPLFPVSKTADKTSVQPGDTITYTITGTNKYNTAVRGIMLRDPVAGASNVFTYAELTNISFSNSAGLAATYTDCGTGTDLAAVNAADAVCVNFTGDLPTNGTVSATLTFKVNAPVFP